MENVPRNRAYPSNQRKPAVGKMPVTKQQVIAMLSSRIEEKCCYATTTNTGVTTTGTLTRMSGVAQGVGQSSRIGDEITLRKFVFAFTATVGATGLVAAADQYNVVRLMVFRYLTDDTVAPPVVANILNTSTTSNLTLASLNFDNRENFKVLYDENIVLYNTPVYSSSTAAPAWYHGVGGTLSHKRIEVPLRGKIDFDTSAGVSGNGHVYTLLVSDSAFSPNPTCEVVSSTIYTDA